MDNIHITKWWEWIPFVGVLLMGVMTFYLIIAMHEPTPIQIWMRRKEIRRVRAQIRWVLLQNRTKWGIGF